MGNGGIHKDLNNFITLWFSRDNQMRSPVDVVQVSHRTLLRYDLHASFNGYTSMADCQT